MAWSSFAHLPTSEDDYYEILCRFESGMYISAVDQIIADSKGKESVSHHYRNNLKNLGLFHVKNGIVTLKYDVSLLRSNKRYLKSILRQAVVTNCSIEIQTIIEIVKQLNSYELKDIVDELVFHNSKLSRENITRWIRPIVFLLKYIEINSITSLNPSDMVTLQNSYLSVAVDFGEAVPIEVVEEHVITQTTSSIIIILENILKNRAYRYKIELLMMPSWATQHKSYLIGTDKYTHIKIKKSLLKEK